MKKKAYLLLAGISCLSILTGCGSSYSKGAYSNSMTTAESVTTDSYYGGYDNYYDVAEEEVWFDDSASMADLGGVEVNESAQAQKSNRKLISTVHLDVETKEFDALLATIESKVSALGGYIENSSTYNGSYYSYRSSRDANMTIRIPSANLNAFVTDVTAISNVTNKSTSVEDVTLAYVDMESRKNALTIEMDNLLEMLDMADTIEDMILIENRLSEVRYQLESMESQLRTYDDKIDYATIYLSVSEVQELTPVEELTPGEEISTGFKDSLADIKNGFTRFGIWFVVNLPKILLTLLPFGIAAIIIVCNVKKAKKRKALKKAAMENAKVTVTSEAVSENKETASDISSENK